MCDKVSGTLETLPANRLGGGISHEAKDKDGDKQNDGVRIVSDKGTPQAASDNISRNDQRDQKASGINIHASHGTDNLGSSQHQASTHQHIGHESIVQKSGVCNPPMPRHHDLRKGMSARGVPLDLDRDQSEQQDLKGAHRPIPHGPTDTVAVCERTARQQRRRPRVTGHDARRDQTGFDAARRGVELLRLAGRVGRVAVLQVGDAEHEGGEEAADADDEAIAGARREHLDAGGGGHGGRGKGYGGM